MAEGEPKGSRDYGEFYMKRFDCAAMAADLLGFQGHERKSLLRTYEAGLRLTHLETEGKTMDPGERDTHLKKTILQMRSNLEGIRRRIATGKHNDEISDARDMLKIAMRELRRAPGAPMVYPDNRALVKANLANITMLSLNLQDKIEEFRKLME
ncbi:MAG: hypothetical protein V1708_06560 [Candidatus Micrarchaeota archaeon]